MHNHLHKRLHKRASTQVTPCHRAAVGPDPALREWVHRADVDAGKGPAGALTSDERAELARLRREIKQLQMERDTL